MDRVRGRLVDGGIAGRIDPVLEADGELAHPLHGVAVVDRPRLAASVVDRACRLEDARLVVGPLETDEGTGVLAEGAVEIIEIDQASGQDVDPADARLPGGREVLGEIADRGVLEAAGDQRVAVGGAEHAPDREVDRLGAAAGEGELARGHAGERREIGAGEFERVPGGLAVPVDGGRIVPVGLQRFGRGGDRLGDRARGGVVVEIGHGGW